MLKSEKYIQTIEKVMKTYKFVPDKIGMLGTRIPYNNIITGDYISVYHGNSSFYGILKFEIGV